MSDKENSEKKEKKSDSKEEKDEQIHEVELSKDIYHIQEQKQSNILSEKLIKLILFQLLKPTELFNKELLKKYDQDDVFDRECLEKMEIEIESFKKSYIDVQFKNIKDLIERFNLVENLKNLSEEKTFAEELNSYGINSEILSFIGPLCEKIKEIENGNKEDNNCPYEIEKDLLKLVEINYYQSKSAQIEENIQKLDQEIEELKNKNKIINN